MQSSLEPIAPGVWTNEAEPRLIGARHPNGKISFPVPTGDAANDVEQVPLSREGKLWSWTSQEFAPKQPYVHTDNFEPFLLGYVEIPGEVIVETYIVDAALDDLKIDMDMELVIVPFTDKRSIYAFRPVEKVN